MIDNEELAHYMIDNKLTKMGLLETNVSQSNNIDDTTRLTVTELHGILDEKNESEA